jgi:acetyl-CoA carboxylase biotin carboxyl carrier protein
MASNPKSKKQMDLERIRELIHMVAQSGVAEVEIEEDDFKLVVRKNASTVMLQPSMMAGYAMNYGQPMYPQAPPPPPVPAYPQPPAAQPQPTAPPQPTSAPAEEEEEETAPAPSEDGTVVRAPIVGTYYAAAAPDADPFVQVGDTVKPGDVLCIIEAMKLMNEIESEMAGTVRQILVENAEPVEYDQPLFVIDPA